ncbi:hypothetical protein [Desulfosporosinus orientis]|nr:hypothetical protein [Desulfosporosinus orientis]
MSNLDVTPQDVYSKKVTVVGLAARRVQEPSRNERFRRVLK